MLNSLSTQSGNFSDIVSVESPATFPSYLSLVVDVCSLHDEFFDTVIMAAVGRHHQRCCSILKRNVSDVTYQDELLLYARFSILTVETLSFHKENAKWM